MTSLLLAGLLVLDVPPLEDALRTPRGKPWIRLEAPRIEQPLRRDDDRLELVIIVDRAEIPDDSKMLVPTPPAPPDSKIYVTVTPPEHVFSPEPEPSPPRTK